MTTMKVMMKMMIITITMTTMKTTMVTASVTMITLSTMKRSFWNVSEIANVSKSEIRRRRPYPEEVSIVPSASNLSDPVDSCNQHKP